jgi:hypothetical protein
MFSIQATVLKMPALAYGNFRRWEQRIVRIPEQFSPQEVHPIGKDRLNVSNES